MTQRRRRVAAVVVAVAVLLVGAALVARGCGNDDPLADGAVGLVPETALVYAHVSTDEHRDANERTAELLDRFDGYARRRDAILQRLSGSTEPVDLERDVEPWLGDEAAFALLDAGTATAGSLVILGVTDEEQARAFLDRNPRRPIIREYKGESIAEYGSVSVAFKDGFMVIGQGPSVQAALDRANERGGSLASVDAYRRATRALPDGRVGHVFATADGLRRLLVPQGGVVGGLAALLDQRGLRSVAVALEPADEGARLSVRSALDPGRRGGPLRAFEPKLLDAVPEDALGFLAVNGISGALGRIVGAAAGNPAGGSVAPLLERLRGQLDREAGGRLQRDLLDVLRGEVELVLLKATPAPILAAVARTSDEESTRETLRRLQAPLARLLTPRGEAAPTWRPEDFGDGVRGATLATPVGASLSYAVFDGRLVAATSPDGVRRIRGTDGSIRDAEGFDAVLGNRPDEVGSLGFLDFSQLLELGEQTGLNDSRAYLAARDDLRKIRAVGVHSTGSEEETTAEILLSIP